MLYTHGVQTAFHEGFDLCVFVAEGHILLISWFSVFCVCLAAAELFWVSPKWVYDDRCSFLMISMFWQPGRFFFFWVFINYAVECVIMTTETRNVVKSEIVRHWMHWLTWDVRAQTSTLAQIQSTINKDMKMFLIKIWTGEAERAGSNLVFIYIYIFI